jgi:hypothetical protein
MSRLAWKIGLASAWSLAVLAITANAVAANLVVNGDFEAGNSGFSSDYAYAPGSNTTESQYTVRTDPFPWNGFFVSHGDHTNGTGLMYVGNGDPTPDSIVWESATAVTVLPNTDYFFEAWAMNVCCNLSYSGPNSPAVLEFAVVGLAVESLGTIATKFPAGEWQFLGTTWNSGANTSVVLQIVNQNTAIGGNDFALDDIHFSTESSIPEPGTLTLLAVAAGLLLFVPPRRR